MDDRRRRGELLGAFAAAAAGAIPVHRLPVLSPADAAAVAELVHDEVDRGDAARAAHAREGGHEIACRRGCNDCCANVIVTYEPEAVRVARWLASPANAAARAWFQRAYPGWRARTHEATTRMRERHARGDVAGAEAAYHEVQAQRVMCAFNQGGACVIHEVRPNVCRNAHALDTPERCRPGSAERPLALEFPPLDELVSRALATFRAMHRRMRGTEGPPALCDAVARLLDDPATLAASPSGRNATCPCGSGKKFKRCCGA